MARSARFLAGQASALQRNIGGHFGRRCSIRVYPRKSAVRFYSNIRIAAAIVVVHSDFLSPTADWVMFIVRTILFDIR